MSFPLTDHEISVLNDVKANGTRPEVRRAQIVLLAAGEQPIPRIAKTVKLSEQRVRFWLREWEKNGLAIFPVPGETANPAEHEPVPVEAAPAEVAPPNDPVPGVTVPRLPLMLHDVIGIDPDAPMSEAGRKTLYFHFERMLLNEPGSRLGEDIEAVHDMRVATRRMRSAIRLFRPFLERKELKAFNANLRITAHTLGQVRDLDVMIDNAEQYVADYPEHDLTAALNIWFKQRDKARRALIKLLDTKDFARFVKRFNAFLTTLGAATVPTNEGYAAVPYRVRHLVPRLIYAHYEQVRAYEAVLDGAPVETLHALRIDFKRLRYALEFFREVLGPEVEAVITATKKMQDHLGYLNDTQVVGQELRSIVDAHHARYSGTPMFMRPENISGVVAYAEAQEADKADLLAGFPMAWAGFCSDEVKQALAMSVAVL